MKHRNEYYLEYVYRPGRTYGDRLLGHLVAELRDTGATCFDELPDYQCLRGTRNEMADKVISVAWRRDGKIAGFCSAVLLPVEGVGKVFHMGLTCVRPEDRGSGLTHQLSSKALITYLMRRHPFGRIWVSNCACVLSSLGNIALYFDNVYPSPFRKNGPARTHRLIASAIDLRYRGKMYVMPGARFDMSSFVFRGSVTDTVFQKEETDGKFRHRYQQLNRYYGGLMDFSRGDEVLQVGTVSLLTGLKYALRKRKIHKFVEALQLDPELGDRVAEGSASS